MNAKKVLGHLLLSSIYKYKETKEDYSYAPYTGVLGLKAPGTQDSGFRV